MLRQLLSSALRGLLDHKNTEADKLQAKNELQLANAALLSGGVRQAISHYEAYLEQQPHDCEAINDLGYCYGVIGDNAQAASLFDRAYQLDSSFLPGLGNHAKTLADQQRSEEALGLIRLVKAQSPDSWNADSVLAGLRQGRGEIELACRHAKDAWMKSFDGLRLANCHLFNSSYLPIEEGQLTAEHVFWAATLAPLLDEFQQQPEWMNQAADLAAPHRIRLGYWSPDLRNHSVFFFAYPLISNHDRTNFEIFIYNDSPFQDEQTDKVRQHADHFHATALLGDADLFKLMRSHRLDVLIELAGHTSSNRINLLQGRLAKVQLTGLGYPPTTGLATIDGKLLDVHVCPDASFARYYAERPIRLPESFWSFDPYWAPERIASLPCDDSGVLTYGCFGNISKISDNMLGAWTKIIRQVPDSRLLIRSISFSDPAALEIFRQRVTAAGLAPDRFELRGPASAQDFLNAYNEVDVVLDTYPFNGGTTSCFALFMGALVVTRHGAGLRSRMGLSMLNNLGLAHWAASSREDYIALAVQAAQSRDELREFRRNAEARFKSTALGDGARFCRHVEAACREMLDPSARSSKYPEQRQAVVHLPAREIMRRAYMVSRYGQVQAARRIARYCQQLYPDYLPAHLLLLDETQGDEAVSQLQALIQRYPESEDIAAAQLMLTRLLLAGQCQQSFAGQLDVLRKLQLPDAHDRVFNLMLTNWLSWLLAGSEASAPDRDERLEHGWTLIVEAPACAEFEAFVADVRQRFEAVLGNIRFEFCCSARLARDLPAALSRVTTEYVALTQSNVRLTSLCALKESAAALQACDMVSLGGCFSWDRVTWRRSGFSNKVASVISKSKLWRSRYEVKKMGRSCEKLVQGLALLEGAWLAFRSDLVGRVGPDLLEFSMEFEGAAGMMFEDWSHRLQRQGFRLAASQVLGLLVDLERPICTENSGEASLYLTQLYGFDPLAELEEDHVVFGVPVAGLSEAGLVQMVMFDPDSKCLRDEFSCLTDCIQV